MKSAFRWIRRIIDALVSLVAVAFAGVCVQMMFYEGFSVILLAVVLAFAVMFCWGVERIVNSFIDQAVEELNDDDE